jgi:hypothetical protein
MVPFSARSSVLGVLALPLLVGCASMPEPVAVRTGEPLEVRERSGVSHVKVKEKTGEIRHRDSRGRSTGTSTIYSDRIKAVRWHEWSLHQGDTEVSENDFYRLANDAAAEEEVRSHHASGVFQNRLGFGMFLGGLGAAGAGYYFTTKEPEEGGSEIPAYVMIGGAVVSCIGMYLIANGASKTADKRVLPQERAEAAAERYNRTLPDSAGAAAPDDEASAR